ncbi:MAG: hypothetical protein ICV60_06530 [Pyrinomonadaceae bacterium]|nr:hypothetical protein [Pyrinomonadaceae bacterium]
MEIALLAIAALAIIAAALYWRHRATDTTPNPEKGDIVVELPVREMQADFGRNIKANLAGKTVEVPLLERTREGDIVRLKWKGRGLFRHAYFRVHITDPSVPPDSASSAVLPTLPVEKPPAPVKSNKVKDILGGGRIIDLQPTSATCTSMRNRLLVSCLKVERKAEAELQTALKECPDGTLEELYEHALFKLHRPHKW